MRKRQRITQYTLRAIFLSLEAFLSMVTTSHTHKTLCPIAGKKLKQKLDI